MQRKIFTGVLMTMNGKLGKSVKVIRVSCYLKNNLKYIVQMARSNFFAEKKNVVEDVIDKDDFDNLLPECKG